MIHRLLVKFWGWLQMPDWLQWHLVSLWTPKYRLAVAGILVNQAGQILLCEHTYRRKIPWGLPGGSLKKNEDPASAMEREIFEETGLSFRVERPLMAIRLRKFQQISIIYLCFLTGGEFLPNAEVSRIGFFDFHALPERLLPHEREIIERAHDLLKGSGA